MSDPLRLTGVTPLDPQDPLPEGKWFWRRLIVFLSVALLFAGLAWCLARLPAGDLLAFSRGLMALLALVLVLYLIAPSATQLAELLAALKLRLRGPRTDDARPPDCDDDGGRERGRRGDRDWRDRLPDLPRVPPLPPR